MKYEKPTIEVTLTEDDIITLSNGQNGDGDLLDKGPWN